MPVASLALLVLLAQEPTHSDKLMHAALGASFTLAGVDNGLTQRCLGAGTCREANPLLKPLEGNALAFSLTKLSVDAGVGYLTWRLHTSKNPKVRKAAWVLVIGTIALRSYVVVHNVKQLRDGR